MGEIDQGQARGLIGLPPEHPRLALVERDDQRHHLDLPRMTRRV